MFKKIYIFVLLLVVVSSLFSMTVSFENEDLEISQSGKYSVVTQNGSYYANNEGEPSIPIISHFFEIPAGKEIKNITVTSLTSERITLDSSILPESKQVKLTDDNSNYKLQESSTYTKDVNYPEEILFNYGSANCGSKNIGYVAVYSATYSAKDNSLSTPKEFKIELELKSSTRDFSSVDSYLTKEIQASLGLDVNRTEEQHGYLLIYPEAFASEYADLVNFRKAQGVEVFTITVEEILTSYEGVDDAEKIRNHIISAYQNDGVDFVTLGADVDHIQDRRLWAFDCNYGIPDENHIPGDIYYSCLDGNWNSNMNELYGEDDDEPDYFPEVVIARIPANSTADVRSVVTKILNYEKGTYEDYSVGLGLSMNLWPTSNSVLAQQYIEEMYYPDFIDNTILWDDDNSNYNANLMWNENPNIIQHTGHCSQNVMALQNGHINEQFVNQMTNDYSGILYSIGCWANAIDFNSIAEKLLNVDNHGITAFVGNSRYGWGSPSADAFGFSEFFQKEYARLLFHEEKSIIAESNALQKIPFIPYLSGISVYKWIAYELNVIGDSYFNLFIAEPKEFTVEYRSNGAVTEFYVTDGEEAVAGAVLYCSDESTFITDINGTVSVEDVTSESFSLYKKGFRFYEFETTQESETGFITVEFPEIVVPQEEHNATIRFRNSNETQLNWQVLITENEAIIGQLSGVANLSSDTDYIDIPFNQPSDEVVQISLIDTDSNLTLVARTITLNLAKPEIQQSSIDFVQYPLVEGQSTRCVITYSNTSDYPINSLDLTLSSEEMELTPSTFTFDEELLPNETISVDFVLEMLNDIENLPTLTIEKELNNQYYDLAVEAEILTFSLGDQPLFEGFEEEVEWADVEGWERVSTFAYEDEYSLSCRPTEFGTFDLDLPIVTYTEDLNFSFQYKFKMPMYGKDGFSVYVVNGLTSERILFLGSGGALRYDYIEEDWAEYNLTLSELLLNRPEEGTPITIRFSFEYYTANSSINDYAGNELIGVFFDNMRFDYGDYTDNSNSVVELNSQFTSYPNPSNDGIINIKHYGKAGSEYSIELYNLKGQKIKTIKDRINSSDKGITQLNINQYDKVKLPSGVYFIRYKSFDKVETKKILLLK